MTTTRPDGGAGAVPTAAGPRGGRLPADPRLARELLDGLAEAVLTTGPDQVVTLANALATDLLPEVTPGTDLTRCAVPALAAATRDGTDGFETTHHGRRLSATRRILGGGRCVWYVRDVTEERARADALRAERTRTAFLAEAGGRLGLSPHRDQTLRATATLPVPYLADLALVLYRPPSPADQRPRWIRYAAGDPSPTEGPVPAGLPGLAAALHGDAVPDPWRDADPAALAAVLPPAFADPGPALVCPMPGAGRPAGALILLRRPGRAGFDRRDAELAREYAARAGAAVGAAELYGEQAHLARVLEQSLLPPELPTVPGVTLAGGYRAAGDRLRIGGDFYDVSRIGQGALFALGDVCGRGVGAAVLTGRVRQSLQTLRLVERRPLELIRLLDRALLDTPQPARRSQFTTLLLGTVEGEPAGGVRVRVAGGGHPDPLVVRADGTVGPVRVGGMPVGVLAAARFAETEIRLAPGELLFAYTDGVTGARGGPAGDELFGERRLRRALADAAGLPPATLVDRLLRLVDDWLAGQSQDDIAMLAVTAAEG
ncbi:PP2C family protein-serine/threonine phosphatase [Micromonospora sp. C28SCA-DRY-2]|uniref:PP2C family protein-serine/threonine phosphatase n=1 Tax=Micromonospora sp. C28SCA-DRY-2 TaxID=3059522 RepID=UPI0026768111|nr:PP2C family protein-serine/threonine phosphatase [Micromonospora sp. C28SCA-DRY-2]MDO3702168.1 PP2C family protein-serine/threonine phosphatase [Micromonospora sp. C28SCA-DRY-2]